ncbi:MAG: hypothetical protein QM760_08780 [Nibricoccus sp.]
MKKLLNNPWFVGALALVAIAFVTHSLIPASGGSATTVAVEEPAAADESASDSTGTASSTGSVRDAIKELSSSNTSATRDPFSIRAKAPVASVAQTEKSAPPDIVETVHLTALWTQKGETYALINDRICRVGDKVGRLTLETATQDGVWMTHWNGRDFIGLGKTFTLTTPGLKAAALSLSTDS